MPIEPSVTFHPVFLHLPESNEPIGIGRGAPIVAGSFLSLEGERYRVQETWLILDRHGALEDGFHVYLEGTDKRPRGGS
jgi:hypothetical protein